MSMRKAIAEAHSNLAFIKYWGKFDTKLNIPVNNSISMNLSNAITKTSVEFDSSLKEDEIVFESDNQLGSIFYDRIISHLDRIRDLAGVYLKARVITENNFPAGIGIASSASGFAALTVAATTALSLNLSQSEMSSLARSGSGSACRSIPDGFVEWLAGTNHDSSYAVQIAPADHWDIVVVSVIVNKAMKKLSSSDGQVLAMSNPFMDPRLKMLSKRIDLLRSAILAKDFETFGRETELDAISFHAIAMTTPFEKNSSWFSGIFYWAPETLEIMHSVQEHRSNGKNIYFTLDAGSTIHLLCLKQDLSSVLDFVKQVEKSKPNRYWQMIVNFPAPGARVVSGN
jgi:diphosphomevalonate decarboxylase